MTKLRISITFLAQNTLKNTADAKKVTNVEGQIYIARPSIRQNIQGMDSKSCYKVSSACGGVGELSIHPSKNFCLAKEHLIKGTIHQTGHEDTVFKTVERHKFLPKFKRRRARVGGKKAIGNSCYEGVE